MEFEADYKMICEFMPRYDGNPKTLSYYIREVDNLMRLITPSKEAGALAVVCLIKSRLSGAAIDAIAHEEALNSWPEIKQALLSRLGEPRNEIQVMQELTRIRRNRNEDAESFGKRIRELLDTLYMIGKHSDKSYYENMAIEQYINNLDFHVSIGVRILKPPTLALAIVNARQEEAKLVSRQNPNNNQPPSSQNKSKLDSYKPHSINSPRPNTQHFNSPLNFVPQPHFAPNYNYVPQRNNLTPEQRQQLVDSVLPWKNKPTPGTSKNNSGNFRNGNNFFSRQPNIPHRPQQQVNPPRISSDVTMRSVNKPAPPQFAFEELFYTPYEGNVMPPQFYYDRMCHYPYPDETTSYYPQAEAEEEQPGTSQDFTETQGTDDHS